MIHYKTGKGIVTCKRVSNHRSIEGQEVFVSVSWADRDKVTCPECKIKVGRLFMLQQSKLMKGRK